MFYCVIIFKTNFYFAGTVARCDNSRSSKSSNIQEQRDSCLFVQEWLNKMEDPISSPSEPSGSKINILSNVLISESNDEYSKINEDVYSFSPDAEFMEHFQTIKMSQCKNVVNFDKEDNNSEIADKKSFTTMISSSVENNSIKDPCFVPSESDHEQEPSETSKMDTETKSISIPIITTPNNISLKKQLHQVNLNQNEKLESVETVKNKNYKDKLSYCFYCDKDVSHFSRHLITWHAAESNVQKFLALPPKSRKRREIICTLKKKGNFIRNRSQEAIRPVKRVNANDASEKEDFLPCPYCLGFYKRKCLYRHTKKCSENSKPSTSRQAAQSEGQITLLLGKFSKFDELLNKELFPRMRADKINLIAKKDLLICQYAYSYIKGRKSKGNLDFVRQSVRRLAKLLDYCKQQDGKIKQLLDVLKPTNFTLILNGVNKIAAFNSDKDLYESPVLAMNFGTLLKKCCDLAYTHLIQVENTNQERKDIKILKTLIESQWADEVSAQAAANLNENKFNKNELLPLTNDLKLLSLYLDKSAAEAFNGLQLNKDIHNYNTLKDVIYCQIILLNRRRPAEVAQLKVNTFNAIHGSNNEGNTEFQNCLTEAEKILLNSYTRIVIRGKRGRGVPVLLSPLMLKHFNYMLSVRETFVQENPYVFHTSGKGFIDGTKILYKYALKCGVQKPKSISATKLRKHLATITQLLQFSEKDLEQLSQFMGHTLKTHCDVYRLPDNMFQTAKVSKLLLLMKEGGIEQYKGKNLDEIDVNLDALVEEEPQDIIGKNMECDEEDIENEVPSTLCIPERKKLCKPNKSAVRNTWTIKQKQILAEVFDEHIRKKRAPKEYEVQELIEKYPEEFGNKKWTSIKAVIFNIDVEDDSFELTNSEDSYKPSSTDLEESSEFEGEPTEELRRERDLDVDANAAEPVQENVAENLTEKKKDSNSWKINLHKNLR
ncbi:unnamed protein product [Psylliodes chrysocephalus]|uniref:Uncharacterized protein n=1 Tax=Psylliodes chrysocephalus TaxID=3402493 RepID=A0A9P0CZC6_9CUCU|nr:unnamed protein product [Psylliodes chrysocephala]